ncbi:MAG: phosphate ABC transporter substrate-binding protein [Dehalococcoidia bacterium]|nr:phosphate ABC transporter substrate-binding protein [Dehalococcoidia bacterium]
MRIKSRRNRLTLPLAALLATALALAGCGKGPVTIMEGGSTTVQPLAESWAEAYEAKHPHVDVRVQGGGSSAGVKGAAEGMLDIGAASRDLKSSETETWPDLVKYAVALDGVAIVVNAENPNGVADLTVEEVGDIFASGSNDTWTVLSREEGSGTRETFEKKVMDGEEISAHCEFLPSNGAVKEKVAATANAIGYISLGYVDASVKAVKVSGVACTQGSVRNATYPIARSLYFVTRGEPEGEVKDFIEFCLSNAGQAIVEDEGYISVQ